MRLLAFFLGLLAFCLVFLVPRASFATGILVCQAELLQPTSWDASTRTGQLEAGSAVAIRGYCEAHISAGGVQGGTTVWGANDIKLSRERCSRLTPDPAGSSTRVRTPYLESVATTFDASDQEDSATVGARQNTNLPRSRTYQLRERLTPGRYHLEWGRTQQMTLEVTPVQPLAFCPPELDVPNPPVINNGEIAPNKLVVRESVTTSAPDRPDWEDRKGWSWEAGAGTWLSAASRAEGKGLDPALGAFATVGLHYGRGKHSSSHHEKSGDIFPTEEAIRWCLPIVLCGGLGLLFSSSDMLIGNEFGVDARFAAGPDFARGGLRPVARYASGIFRTPALFNMLLPEVGVEWRRDRGTGLVLAYGLYPVDIRFGSAFALGIDPFRVGVIFGVERRAIVELGAELSLRIAP